ncbi:TPA: hypothetical protein I7245_21155 [Vibrio vulnificus]|uniref:hypothetical protein n=1 Tax=Vibrio vulnificus TaxID=672 RepID=UPI001A2CAEA2|nr:hypothetical protein [Vibrio vulnificus]WHE21959.1 hypothetical protein PVE41_02115 [Vibrio vulnificus]HAS6208304.1 hypothetical protein [Vibrio vulnificus]HAS6336506.1 hypothetical protein [Vibrio vulnificus]HAT8497554.1 hypothetical protein [Vibrio vulnificus]HDY7585427.1 hypothetical protein [Vibrio vulnificus]
MDIESLILVLGGQTVVLGALFAFLGKIAINRINNKEISKANQSLAKLQSDLQKHSTRLSERNESVVHTNKYLIEVEYNYYQKIWAALIRVSPLFDSIEQKILRNEDISAAASELHEARVELGDLLNSAYPFINKKIYNVAYLALDNSTKASACLWVSDSQLKEQQVILEELNLFKSYSNEFHAHNKSTGDCIHIRTKAMVTFHD